MEFYVGIIMLFNELVYCLWYKLLLLYIYTNLLIYIQIQIQINIRM